MSIMINLRENNNFSENEKIVAKYILKNFRQIKKLTQEEIAKRTYTSLATTTRMSKKIGFSGFKEFKIELIEEISNMEKEELSFDIKEIESGSSVKSIINKVNKISIDSLKENKLLQSEEKILEIVKLLEKYDIIDLYGMGASYLVCLDFQYKFLRLGKQVNAFSEQDKQYVSAKISNKKHLAIIISYSGKTPELLEIVKILEAKNIDRISITRYVENDIMKYCNYNLFVSSYESLKRSAAIHSRIAMLNLIDVIYYSFFNNNYEKMKKKIYETKIDKD